jgi:hypothetical protein
MHAGRLVGLLGVFGAAFLSASAAFAQETGTPEDAKPETSDAPTPDMTTAGAADDNARYAWLDAELAKIEGPTERWYTGWTASFGVLALGQYSLGVGAPNSGLREISFAGAINSTLGLGAVLIAPNTLDGTREKLHDFDATTPLGAYERRRRAEYLLHATAAEESFYHSPIPLVLAALSSGAACLILIEGYDQVVGGFATLGAGLAVTAVEMLTRPSSATDAWRRYSTMAHPGPGSQVSPDQINVSFAVTPMGVAMHGTF